MLGTADSLLTTPTRSSTSATPSASSEHNHCVRESLQKLKCNIADLHNKTEACAKKLKTLSRHLIVSPRKRSPCNECCLR